MGALLCDDLGFAPTEKVHENGEINRTCTLRVTSATLAYATHCKISILRDHTWPTKNTEHVLKMYNLTTYVNSNLSFV